jgi:hypothetical protein
MKDNQIIAEFMGYTEKNKKIKEIYNQEAEVKSFSYHTSWDWLMPVIKKCLIGEAEQSEEMSNTTIKNVYEGICNQDISFAYKSVVEFINEYNKTK